MTKKTMTGVLHLHSETGTEGGHWAFQNEEFIGTRVEKRCKKCKNSWNFDDPSTEPDGDEHVPGLNLVLRSCKKGEHDVGEEKVPSWSYSGLEILRDGDHLTIFSKDDPNDVVWEGDIKLKQHNVFTEHAAGMWIHADQVGIDRKRWMMFFFNEHRAKLTKKG